MGYDPTGKVNWLKLGQGVWKVTTGLTAIFSLAKKGFVGSIISSWTYSFLITAASSALGLLGTQQHYIALPVLASIVAIISSSWQLKKILYNIPKGLQEIQQALKEWVNDWKNC